MGTSGKPTREVELLLFDVDEGQPEGTTVTRPVGSSALASVSHPATKETEERKQKRAALKPSQLT